MPKTFLIVGALSCFLAVALGAFGAHYLKNLGIDLAGVETFKTGSQYQAVHGIAMILVGISAQVFGISKKWTASFYCFLIGILLFSGSLYALVLSGVKALGAITPLGGLSLMLGWIIFAVAAASRREDLPS